MTRRSSKSWACTTLDSIFGVERTWSFRSKPGCVVAPWKSYPALTSATFSESVRRTRCVKEECCDLQLITFRSESNRVLTFPQWRSGVNVLKRNSIRLAEVWLDDYAKYYYQRIGNEKGDFGDISERVELRKELKCKSFKWYLDTVYPELFIPGEAMAAGEVRKAFLILCLYRNER